jgi:hypothetical protein
MPWLTMRWMPCAAMVPCVLLSACAAVAEAPPVMHAVGTPLSDVNLVQAPIPGALALAMRQPYAVPAEPVCGALAHDIRALDEVLGADVDTPATTDRPSLIERGVNLANEEVVGTVRRTAEAVVPYRRWVRKLSVAERYSQQSQIAIAAVTVHRAHLRCVPVAHDQAFDSCHVTCSG